MLLHGQRQSLVFVLALLAFKARLDVGLGSLVWWEATLHIAGGLKLHDHCGPFQPRPFYDKPQSRCLIHTLLTSKNLPIIQTF